MAFFGINASEFLILVALAVIFFGPERIPEFSRKAARVIWYVRNIANDATHQLKDELGPEYKDLTIQDLNPKTFVQKHLLDELQADLDGVKNELDGVKKDLNQVGRDATVATAGMNAAAKTIGKTGRAQSGASDAPAVTAMQQKYGLCFDLDAT